jgi:uncharacterized protein
MSGDEGRAAIAETHVSMLVFVGDRAYKLEKPVAMGFLDFFRREAREAACRRSRWPTSTGRTAACATTWW